MMKPLHRSRTFWSGIVVLACLCGLWVDSMYRVRAMVLHRGVFIESHGFLHQEGSIDLFSQRSPGARPREPWQMAVKTSPGEEAVPWFPALHWERQEYGTTIFYGLRLPYWLVMGVVAMVWAAMLWRRRRLLRSGAAAMQAADGSVVSG
jgi:hypothetical protein